MSRRTDEFQTIRSEGGLLTPDLLRRVIDPKAKLAGTRPEDYGLPQNERLNEVITQSWNRLRKHWVEFGAAAAILPEGEGGTGLTNDKWSLPLLRELGFGLLPTSAGPELGGRTYAISRFFGPVAVHLVGCRLSLDRRAAGQRGAAAVNPHGLVQEFVNRSPGHLWAIVSNGLRLRVLRDSQALSRQSFLEFDLEAMFHGEVYSDFVLLWLMVHATRFAPRENDRPETCWLEHWTKESAEHGTRILEGLRGGVERALLILGEGFTSHPKNARLRDALRTGAISLADFHGELLRVVYRLIFLFVAEDRTLDGRPLLHPRDDTEQAGLARERYGAHYSTARLRELAGKIKGSRHGDLWRQFKIPVDALSGSDTSAVVRQQLALPTLGSFLWNPTSTAALNDTELTNYDFLEALRHLAFTRQGKVLRPVDYKNLGAEELGGVYESLLALTPQISADGARFTFAEFAGNERKTSGSYYTPDSLVHCLLDSALDPVVDEAIKGKAGLEAQQALLALKICDPAVGSGHFLVGAAHRLARHLSRLRAIAQGESEPSPLLYQRALRDVIGRCLYGVDLNPMAAELCRVSLWLEAMEPGKPLSFLDHHIRVGNSLLGTTPELIAGGLPDETFTAIEGDDKKACSVLKKRNKAQRTGMGPLFAEQDAELQARLQKAAAALEELPDDRPGDIRAKEVAFLRREETDEYRQKKILADAWCAAFVAEKRFREPGREASATGITQGHLTDLAAGRSLPAQLTAETQHLPTQYQFFHWHLAFPEVFANGGFDCVLGNPPWEQLQLDPQEFFAALAPEIAAAEHMTARSKAIDSLKQTDAALYASYQEAVRHSDGVKHFVHASGIAPLTSFGRLNTAPLFAEVSLRIRRPHGRVGLIVPSGLATDSFNQYFFQKLMTSGLLVSLWEFENEGFFTAGKGHMLRFALTTMGAGSGIADFFFQGKDLVELQVADRHFQLTAEDVALVNPNTMTCPIFQSKRDAKITTGVYRRIPVLARDGQEGGWTFQGLLMLMMNTDSKVFRNKTQLMDDAFELRGNVFFRDQERYVPLIEAKMVYSYQHRHGDYSKVVVGDDPHRLPLLTNGELLDPLGTFIPRYWVPEEAVRQRLATRWTRHWLLGWRDVTDSRASVRTVVSTIVPAVGVGHKFCLVTSSQEPARIACLQGVFGSFVFDYIARQKVGGLSLPFFIMRQLPVPPPDVFLEQSKWNEVTLQEWVLTRVLELTYTAWDLEPFARDVGFDGPPFRWDPARRQLLRAELDAAFFHLYGLSRDDADYVMETFPIVRKNDNKTYGEYRTKRVILEMYDAMLEAISTGRPYQSHLEPPPADPRCCHPPKMRD